MKQVSLVHRWSFIAASAIAASFATATAHAQGVPQGSYLRSCTHVETNGGRLTADCRRTDGSWSRTALRDVSRCVGDIGNQDGELTCNGGRPDYSWRERNYDRSPSYGYGRYGGPGYGSSREYGPLPSYPSYYGR